MNSLNSPSDVVPDETAATPEETRLTLLERSNRAFAPIHKVFVQDPDKNKPHRAGPLAVFVSNGDLRGLRAFCLLHAIISSGAGENGWSTTLPIRVWARAFGTTRHASSQEAATSAATKILTRLEQRQLITRRRSGRERKVAVTLLRPDGSGKPYTRPGMQNDDLFLKLPNVYWTDGWYDRLDLPATAMLLVALHEKEGFELPTENMKAWYGWSPDTALRGFRTLRQLQVLSVTTRLRKAPLSPSGLASVNVYRLLSPFENSKDRPGSTGDQG